MLPGRAEAKIDLRLVPDMTKDEAVAKLKAHLAKRGFGDIEVIVSGGYGPTETPRTASSSRPGGDAQPAGIEDSLFARRAGSWPGVVFTATAPVGGRSFGAGRGGGAHAPDEWLLIEAAIPRSRALRSRREIFADYLYEIAGG